MILSRIHESSTPGITVKEKAIVFSQNELQKICLVEKEKEKSLGHIVKTVGGEERAKMMVMDRQPVETKRREEKVENVIARAWKASGRGKETSNQIAKETRREGKGGKATTTPTMETRREGGKGGEAVESGKGFVTLGAASDGSAKCKQSGVVVRESSSVPDGNHDLTAERTRHDSILRTNAISRKVQSHTKDHHNTSKECQCQGLSSRKDQTHTKYQGKSSRRYEWPGTSHQYPCRPHTGIQSGLRSPVLALLVLLLVLPSSLALPAVIRIGKYSVTFFFFFL